ncbi:hypothetical protein ACFL4K_00705 [Candidatus Neomarinimicrobiota bacterium]
MTNVQQALDKIAGYNVDTIMSGLFEIQKDLHNYGRDELLTVTDTFGSLFFIDSFDRSDLQPVVETTI